MLGRQGTPKLRVRLLKSGCRQNGFFRRWGDASFLGLREAIAHFLEQHLHCQICWNATRSFYVEDFIPTSRIFLSDNSNNFFEGFFSRSTLHHLAIICYFYESQVWSCNCLDLSTLTYSTIIRDLRTTWAKNATPHGESTPFCINSSPSTSTNT